MVEIHRGQEYKIEKLSTKTIMVRDIVRVNVLKLSEIHKLKYKDRCVKVVHMTGDVEYLTYQELTNRYTHISGKRVNIKFLKRGLNYILVGRAEKEFKALAIPKGSTLNICGNTIKGNNVILYEYNKPIELGKERIVSKDNFVKAFVTPKLNSELNKEKQTTNKNTSKFNKNNIDKVQRKIASKNSNIENVTKKDDSTIRQIRKDNKNNNLYKIIGLITNSNGTVIGYLVTGTKGDKHEISKLKALQMCMNKKIVNAEVVTNSKGNKFIRGNGESLDKLRKYIK